MDPKFVNAPADRTAVAEVAETQAINAGMKPLPTSLVAERAHPILERAAPIRAHEQSNLTFLRIHGSVVVMRQSVKRISYGLSTNGTVTE